MTVLLSIFGIGQVVAQIYGLLCSRFQAQSILGGDVAPEIDWSLDGELKPAERF